MKSPFPMTVVLATLTFAGSPLSMVLADTICDRPEVERLLPAPPAGCQPIRIVASGGVSFGIIRGPEAAAMNAWRREVITKFGERYEDWRNAACKKVECGPGNIAGTHICTASAYPCSPAVDPEVLDALAARSPTVPETTRRK